jgi:ribonuclease PH
MRPSSRSANELRQVSFEIGFTPYAEGSCLVKFGNTHVLCNVSVEERLPPFLRDSKQGWITAEYGMLPRATHQRVDREASRGRQSGRTMEIQRLIGRSLRAIVDLKALGERQLKVDCDVLQADGGTRTAAISGAYVALHVALSKLVENKVISALPLTDQIAAVSCGIYKGKPLLDLDYDEDSNAEADANFILTSKGNIVEIQTTAEESPFDPSAFQSMYDLAKKGTAEIAYLQTKAIMGK